MIIHVYFLFFEKMKKYNFEEKSHGQNSNDELKFGFICIS